MRRLLLLLSVLAATACARLGLEPVLEPANDRPFKFRHDSFAFANELKWHYKMDPVTGERTDTEENKDADYALHCFVLARSARQFFQFARFDRNLPKVSEDDYRKLVESVIAHDPAISEPAEQRVVIPGYASLHRFSAEHEALLKGSLGSAVHSYIQRGNWRMVFPFSAGHQQEMARTLAAEIRANRPPIVHLVLFPRIKINHAVLLYGVKEKKHVTRFKVYDPNDAKHPLELTWDARERVFKLPPNNYFPGGTVDVYEVYKSPIL